MKFKGKMEDGSNKVCERSEANNEIKFERFGYGK